MNKYELMVIYNSGLKEDEVKKNISTLKDKIKDLKGNLTSEDYWGLKDLAYEINKATKAYFLVVKAELEPASAKNLSVWISGQASILRNLLTKVN
jgi:small subunit ribosomal protein S6